MSSRKRRTASVWPAQDLLDEVVQDEPVAARERLDETVGVVGVAQGQSRELEPGGPALGAGAERRACVLG